MGGILQTYARQSAPPEHRVELFVRGETRLTWIGLLFNEYRDAEVYLVGGTLRDVILGRVPNDIDLLVRNVPPAELDIWLNAHGAAEFVGRFGTYKFVPNGNVNKQAIDIALPRTERKLEDHAGGRRDMDVSFDYKLPIKDDLGRRDFTINAMAYNIKTGRLIDPFLGLQDLYNEIINSVLIPATRFEEDATRLLRGLRFASQLNFGIEKFTWQALLANIELLNKKTLTEDGTQAYIVPREAIGREFILGFMEHPVHTLRLWSESKALHMFIPELAELEYTSNDELQKTLNLLNTLKNKSFIAGYGFLNTPLNVLVAGLMVFTHGDKHKHAHNICTKLHFHQFPLGHKANMNCETIKWLVEHVDIFEEIDPASIRPSQFEKMFLSKRGQELLLLMHAKHVASAKHSVARERLHTARRIKDQMQMIFANSDLNGKLPQLISGRDIQEFGIQPGPAYREILDKIRDAQLAGEIISFDDAKTLLRHIVTKT